MSNKSIYRKIIKSFRNRLNVDFCELFIVVHDVSCGCLTQSQFEEVLENSRKHFQISLDESNY